MACKLKCPACGRVLREEGDDGKQADGQYRVYDSLSSSGAPAHASRIIECLVCRTALRADRWDDLTATPAPMPACQEAVLSVEPLESVSGDVHLCRSCMHSMTPWAPEVAAEGWVGCDWQLRKVMRSPLPGDSAFPPGLVGSSNEAAYGWVSSRRYPAKTGGGRLFNDQPMFKNITGCSRYVKYEVP